MLGGFAASTGELGLTRFFLGGGQRLSRGGILGNLRIQNKVDRQRLAKDAVEDLLQTRSFFLAALYIKRAGKADGQSRIIPLHGASVAQIGQDGRLFQDLAHDGGKVTTWLRRGSRRGSGCRRWR